MPVLPTRVDPRSEDHKLNAEALQAVVADLDARLAEAALGGGDKARKKHLERDKLLPRDRIAALLDPGSPFLEFSPLAAYGMYEGQAPGAGIVTGIGRVH